MTKQHRTSHSCILYQIMLFHSWSFAWFQRLKLFNARHDFCSFIRSQRPKSAVVPCFSVSAPLSSACQKISIPGYCCLWSPSGQAQEIVSPQRSGGCPLGRYANARNILFLSEHGCVMDHDTSVC